MRTPEIQAAWPARVTFRSALGYALLPGILPRLRSLAAALSRFMFVFTQVFGMTGLIDRNHPCLRAENIGRYRFVDVVGLALYGVLLDRKNPYKIVMFIMSILTIIMVLVLAVVSLGLLIAWIPKAHAQFFSDYPDGQGYEKANDWSYSFLADLFGNTGITFWGTQGTTDKHILFNAMLREMFSTYSQALLVIAVFMIIYHVVIMVAESARTGEPFGQSFNSVWAPVRLALAIGLLVPISNGYNGAQLVAFQVAGWGSALATNVWIKGLTSFGDMQPNPNGSGFIVSQDVTNNAAHKLIMAMQPSNGYAFMRGLFLTELCKELVKKADFASIRTGGVQNTYENEGVYRYVQAGTYFNGGGVATYTPALLALNIDYCGTYKIPRASQFDVEEVPLMTTQANSNDAVHLSELSSAIAAGYEEFYKEMRIANGTGFTFLNYGEPTEEQKAGVIVDAARKIATVLYNDQNLSIQEINDDAVTQMHLKMLQSYQGNLGWDSTKNLFFQSSVFKDAANNDGEALVQVLFSGKKYGWASAGSIMMSLAHVNNLISMAVNSPPTSTSLPRLMVNPMADPYMRNSSLEEGGFLSNVQSWFGLETKTDATKKMNVILNKANTWFIDRIRDPAPSGGTIAEATHTSPSAWRAALAGRDSGNTTDIDMSSGSSIQSFLLSFVQMNNENMNPLSQIVNIGGSLFVMAGGIITAGLIANFWVPGTLSLAMSIGIPMILGAYLLAVVLPFSLFANFMFAVIEWAISVFEAVVGMPLWALSFISVSGEGVGEKAMNGALMLFEIMLRPTIIVIVAVGTMVIFAASVHFFNKAFTLFMKSYFDSTDGVVKNMLVVFGSIFMYVMTVYSIGNACFKLIGEIANKFGRWAGLPGGFSGAMKFEMSTLAGAAVMGAVAKMGSSVGGAVGGAMDKKRAIPYQDKKKEERDFEELVNKNYAAHLRAGGTDSYQDFRQKQRDQWEETKHERNNKRHFDPNYGSAGGSSGGGSNSAEFSKINTDLADIRSMLSAIMANMSNRRGP